MIDAVSGMGRRTSGRGAVVVRPSQRYMRGQNLGNENSPRNGAHRYDNEAYCDVSFGQQPHGAWHNGVDSLPLSDY